jgi:lincosamide nucleotidyltransferase B/F
MTKEHILQRLTEISETVRRTHDALAFLALGSVGKENERMDEFSDLDFFVIAKDDKKQRFIQNLDWLKAQGKVSFVFQNTVDGCKLIYEDGIMCEFAVFTSAEFTSAAYSEGLFLWKDDAFVSVNPKPRRFPKYLEESEDYMLGEALTNLYVGLGRFLRGEKLSAFYFIQDYAVHRVMTLIAKKFPSKEPFIDLYNPDRRFEKRYSWFASDISQMTQGYDRTPESARILLTFLDEHFSISQSLKRQIAMLIDRCK